MKNKERLPYVSLLLALLLNSLLLTNAVSAEWHGLYGLDEEQLTEKIDVFTLKLNKSPQDYEIVKSLGIAYHFKAGIDADAFAAMAVEYLTKAHEFDQKDYVTMCYLGAATSRMAQITWNPLRKMDYSNTGMGLMDKAVRKAPDNVTVRMARGKASLNMPSFLGRGDLAVEDFEYLAGLIEQNPESYSSLREEVHEILAKIRSHK